MIGVIVPTQTITYVTDLEWSYAPSHHSFNKLVKTLEVNEYSKLKIRQDSSFIDQSLSNGHPQRIVPNRKIICNCVNNSFY